MGWHLKARHFVAVIFKTITNFRNAKGVYKDFRGCSAKEKRQVKQRLEATEWKINHVNDSRSVFCAKA